MRWLGGPKNFTFRVKNGQPNNVHAEVGRWAKKVKIISISLAFLPLLGMIQLPRRHEFALFCPPAYLYMKHLISLSLAFNQSINYLIIGGQFLGVIQ
jgi:hypothetical protein